VIGEDRGGTQQGRNNPSPGFFASIKGRGGLQIVGSPDTQRVWAIPGCIERSRDMVPDKDRRFVVSFSTGKTVPIMVAQCPRNKEKEGDVSLSIPKTREKSGSEIKIARRGDVPEKSGIRVPEPGREKKIKMGITGPEGPNNKEVNMPPTREM
jgi:hypothetical protein